MKRLTREEYIAKAMLLDMKYMASSHMLLRKNKDPQDDQRYDPDTLEPLSNHHLDIHDRMDQVQRGEIGCDPPYTRRIKLTGR